MVPVWLFVVPQNRGGASVLFVAPLVLGGLLRSRYAAQRQLAAEEERDSHAGCGACGAGGSGRRADGGCGGVSDADRGGRGSGDGAAVAVIVPGVGTTADNFDHGLGGVRRRSPSWQARQLYAAAGGARSRIAVVAWLGYQPPSGVGIAAARSERAIEGARALRRYLRGLPRKVVLIGHSYGS